jgi:SNF2 family DNA or RNA helicase
MTTEITISYDLNNYDAIITGRAEFYSALWFQQVLRLFNDKTDEVVYDVSGIIKVPWWAFLSARKEFGTILKSNSIAYSLTEEARFFLQKSIDNESTYNKAVASKELTVQEIQSQLDSKGWDWINRPLTSHQLRNVQKIIKFYASATFSVPGAGKTTEALAYYLLKAKINTKLIIICPKNAFISWDEQLSICLKNTSDYFIRLRGGLENIIKLLKHNSNHYIITYQQFARVSDALARFLHENETFVFLDESHRIKSGRGKITADNILKIAHLPHGKLIMSGTPMPQSPDDLIPQYEFLYPEIKVSSADVIDKIQPIFVRTTKRN